MLLYNYRKGNSLDGTRTVVSFAVLSLLYAATDLQKSFKKTKKLVDKTSKLVYNSIKDKGKTFYKIKPSTFKITY